MLFSAKLLLLELGADCWNMLSVCWLDVDCFLCSQMILTYPYSFKQPVCSHQCTSSNLWFGNKVPPFKSLWMYCHSQLPCMVLHGETPCNEQMLGRGFFCASILGSAMTRPHRFWTENWLRHAIRSRRADAWTANMYPEISRDSPTFETLHTLTIHFCCHNYIASIALIVATTAPLGSFSNESKQLQVIT